MHCGFFDSGFNSSCKWSISLRCDWKAFEKQTAHSSDLWNSRPWTRHQHFAQNVPTQMEQPNVSNGNISLHFHWKHPSIKDLYKCILISVKSIFFFFLHSWDTLWFMELKIYYKTKSKEHLASSTCCYKPKCNSINYYNYMCPEKMMWSPPSLYLCTTVILTKLTHDSHFGISDCAELQWLHNPECVCECVCHRELWVAERRMKDDLVWHRSFILHLKSSEVAQCAQLLQVHRDSNPQLNCSSLWMPHMLAVQHEDFWEM